MNFSPIIVVGGETQSVFIEILFKAIKKIQYPIILISSKNILNQNIKKFGYNIQLNQLKTDIIYFGFRFWHLFKSKKNILKLNSIDQFDLILDLQSKLRNTLILKQFPSKNFYSSTLNFKFCTVSKNYISPKFDIKNVLTNVEKLLDIEITFNL